MFSFFHLNKISPEARRAPPLCPTGDGSRTIKTRSVPIVSQATPLSLCLAANNAHPMLHPGLTNVGRMIFWGRYGTEHQCISTQFHRLRGTRKHLNNPRSVTPPAGTCTLVSLLELGAWTTADLASWVLKRCEKKGTQALETQLRVAN